jgi:hypothetical protein
MLRLTCKPLALVVLAFSFAPANAACKGDALESLMTNVLYHEAVPRIRAQAAVAATVFNRHRQTGRSLCAVMTRRNAYVHRPVRRGERVKMASSRRAASVFLREHAQGYHATAGNVFAMFRERGYNSFYATYAKIPGRYRRPGINIGDNHFYRHGGLTRVSHHHRRHHHRPLTQMTAD